MGVGDFEKLYSDGSDGDRSLTERLASEADNLLRKVVEVADGFKGVALDKRKGVTEDLDLSKIDLSTMSYPEFVKLSRDQRLKLISDCQGAPTEGQTITFNFKKNKELIDTVRLADMPYYIRQVESGGHLYNRKAGGSFYGADGYLFIGENTEVIVKKIDPNYSAENLKAEYSFGELKGGADVAKCALELGIDANLLDVFLKIGKNIGLQDGETQSFLNRHGGFIQRKLMAYGPKAVKDGRYSRDFVKSVLAADFPGLRDRDKYVDMYFVADKGEPVVPAPVAEPNWVPELLPPDEPSLRNEPPPAIATIPAPLAIRFRGEKEDPVQISAVRNETPPVIDKKNVLKVDDRVMVHPPDLAVVAPIVARMRRTEPLIRVDGRQYTHETPAQLFAYAEAIAASMGYRIGVTSGYRTVDQQKHLHEHAFVDQQKHLHEHAENNEGNMMVASAGRSRHNFGAAMDVALYAPDKNGKLRQLTRLPDDKGKFKKGYADILEQIMNRAGFVRYSVESWHYEAGSKEWAEIMKAREVLAKDADSNQYVYTLADVGRKPRKKEDRLVAKYQPQSYQPELMAGPEFYHEDEQPQPVSAVESGVDAPKDLNEIWRKRREVFEQGLESFDGQTVVRNLPGNGGRPVGILIPSGTDLNKPVEVVYQIHGMDCEKFGQDPDADEALGIFAKAVSATRGNVVFVYPLGREYRKKYTEKRQWFGQGSGDDPALMHGEVLAEIAKMKAQSLNISATTPIEVSKVTLKGHSAGGQAMRNMIDAGFVADRYDFDDASYGWARAAYEGVIKNTPKDKKFEFNVFARAGTSTDPDARSLLGKPGVKVTWEDPNKVSHEGMVAKYFNYERPDQQLHASNNSKPEKPAT